ncbi:MAG: OmpH family outer membrane protein [Acidobacteria bacterium]|nr:OmpH family outer membrane protein [Acidobacteriota bacterium]
MRKTFFAVIGLVFVSQGASLLAQDPAPPPLQASPPAAIGAAKVAWVDLEQVIMLCEEGKRELTELQQLIDKRTAEMRGLQQEAQFLADQLRVQGDKLRVEAREELQGQIENKNIQLQRFQEDSQKEVDYRRARITNSMTGKVLPVIQDVAKARGLSFVMYLNPSVAAWVDPALVITDEIVTTYNAAHPVAAPPAAVPPQP